MNALFLKDLAAKTHRGIGGRVVEAEAIDRLPLAEWHRDKEVTGKMRGPLTRLCARYLLRAKSIARACWNASSRQGTGPVLPLAQAEKCS